MNIEQANAVPILHVLEVMGLKPDKQKGDDVWFLSPLRAEKTASFKVQTRKNVWYDFGEGKGGDTVGFAVALLSSYNAPNSVSDGLNWIENRFDGIPLAPARVCNKIEKSKSKVLTIKKLQPVQHRLLIRYLESRGITLAVAKKYLKQLCLFNADTKKDFYALGLCNEEDGFEIRNPFFKGSIGTKAITFLRGTMPKPSGIHIFEGMMDYLSVLETRSLPQLSEDSIVLNSLSNLSSAYPYIQDYGYSVAYTWLDNDTAAAKAQKKLIDFLSTQADLKHKPMNAVYHPHKDVNAWHMSRLGLSITP